jgi:hypothetical protein
MLEARNIGFQTSLDVANLVQCLQSVDDPIQANGQSRDECRNRTKKECRAVTWAMTCDSCVTDGGSGNIVYPAVVRFATREAICAAVERALHAMMKHANAAIE